MSGKFEEIMAASKLSELLQKKDEDHTKKGDCLGTGYYRSRCGCRGDCLCRILILYTGLSGRF